MKRREFSQALIAAASAMLLPRVTNAHGEEISKMDAAQMASGVGDAGGLTDVEGIKVGHFTETRRPTGCTVMLCEKGATCGVDVRGGAPGTRETDLLNPINLVQEIYGLVLSGGSAYGLDTATGVMRATMGFWANAGGALALDQLTDLACEALAAGLPEDCSLRNVVAISERKHSS